MFKILKKYSYFQYKKKKTNELISSIKKNEDDYILKEDNMKLMTKLMDRKAQLTYVFEDLEQNYSIKPKPCQENIDWYNKSKNNSENREH